MLFRLLTVLMNNSGEELLLLFNATASVGGPSGDGLLLPDGASFFLLPDDSFFLLP